MKYHICPGTHRKSHAKVVSILDANSGYRIMRASAKLMQHLAPYLEVKTPPLFYPGCISSNRVSKV